MWDDLGRANNITGTTDILSKVFFVQNCNQYWWKIFYKINKNTKEFFERYYDSHRTLTFHLQRLQNSQKFYLNLFPMLFLIKVALIVTLNPNRQWEKKCMYITRSFWNVQTLETTKVTLTATSFRCPIWNVL